MKTCILNFFILVLILFSATCSAMEKIELPNGAIAYLEYPSDFNIHKRYPLLIALHGMGHDAQRACREWGSIANKYGYVMLAPQGTGDRNSYLNSIDKNVQNIFSFIKELNRRANLKKDDTVVAGFSMGGSFAVDLGLRHPHRFPRIISVFGFFVKRHEHWLTIQNKEYVVPQHYYFITGDKDITRGSLSRGYEALLEKGALVKVDVIKDLYHDFPADFVDFYTSIDSFFKKEHDLNI